MSDCQKDKCKELWQKDDKIVSKDIEIVVERIEGMKEAVILKAQETETRTKARISIVGIILAALQIIIILITYIK